MDHSVRVDNRMLTLAEVLVAALLCLSCAQHQPRRTGIYILNAPNQSNAEPKYFEAACPDMTLIKDVQHADYTLGAVWAGTKWRVVVSRKDGAGIIFEDSTPDVIETFRRTCAAIRDDAKEVAEFNAHSPPMPIGRYVLQSAASNRVFLLDTQTGAVWELQDLGLYQEFERVRVDGLYIDNPLAPMPIKPQRSLSKTR